MQNKLAGLWFCSSPRFLTKDFQSVYLRKIKIFSPLQEFSVEDFFFFNLLHQRKKIKIRLKALLGASFEALLSPYTRSSGITQRLAALAALCFSPLSTKTTNPVSVATILQ